MLITKKRLGIEQLVEEFADKTNVRGVNRYVKAGGFLREYPDKSYLIDKHGKVVVSTCCK